MRILQVNSRDILGGAEAIALNLHRHYRKLGHQTWLAVGEQPGPEPNVIRMQNGSGPRGWSQFWWSLDDRLARKHAYGSSVRRGIRLVADPRRLIDQQQGRENFRFPGTWQLPDSLPDRLDVLHAHNLHGHYFDLRALPKLSRRLPVLLTLHDAWLLSGHCAHSFDCERWKIGCGHCPDLSIYPAIRRDATRENWIAKQSIFLHCRLFVATPCEWLRNRVEQSLMWPGVCDLEVIPHGVDLAIFREGSQAQARLELGLAADARIVLIPANSLTVNIWKDYEIARQTVARLSSVSFDRPLQLVAIGSAGSDSPAAFPAIRFVGHQSDPHVIGRYLQAADVYVHAARADTFPNAVMEAMACGTPVVATAVGGIPEQVDDGINGLLTPLGDSEAMILAIKGLVMDDDFRKACSLSAAAKAKKQFDFVRYANACLAWYDRARMAFETRRAVPDG